jgi:hypothetical protein|tara:strand:+ start:1962 stop:2144 length:183 start_codon:yes stop_codon:yes gene_type:complete
MGAYKSKGVNMLIFNIAEIVANIFILGLGICFWVLGIFGIVMLVSILNKMIKEITKKELV